MATDLQSETSRRNGAKSRGPRTPEGKSKSARNATTHGMLRKVIVIEGEDPARFAALLADFRAVLQPRNRIEEEMIEDLAAFRWRQRRLLVMETTCLTGEIHRLEDQGIHTPRASQPSHTATRPKSHRASIHAMRAVTAFANLSGDSRTLDLIHRYELRFSRQYNRTLRQLFALRALERPEKS